MDKNTSRIRERFEKRRLKRLENFGISRGNLYLFGWVAFVFVFSLLSSVSSGFQSRRQLFDKVGSFPHRRHFSTISLAFLVCFYFPANGHEFQDTHSKWSKLFNEK